PGGAADFAGAEPTLTSGHSRNQDEYLEWHVTRNGSGKITSVEFTCEGYDYYEFLGREAADILLGLYQKFISPAVRHADLFTGAQYQKLNRWNTADGAMHLTQQANNLFAEVILAAEATVRRRDAVGREVTAAIPLTKCSQFGGQIAQNITMRLTGVASVANNVQNTPIPCEGAGGAVHTAIAVAASRLPTRGAS